MNSLFLLKIQREVDAHNNIILYHGITKSESEDHDNNINYMLVMEYADGGNLRSYLKNNFISSNFQSELFGIVPYVDPKSFNKQENNNNETQLYLLNEKWDVYSVDKSIVLDTHEDYVKIYTKCWDGEPDNRPTIYQVGTEGNLVREQVIKNFNNYNNTSSHEIYNWLLNNRNNSNSIFLLGYIYYQEIEASENDEKAFNLFIDASGTNHLLAQHFVGECYQYRYGVKKMKSVEKDLKMAFYWYEKASNYGNIKAMNNLGLCMKMEKVLKKIIIKPLNCSSNQLKEEI
ncbi:kinase-like domain-containing protein [Rhizophagus clarus]|uniref:Kinase-like domain-containing protein n=1 Tax=Rhizophagus clarus TaxID=94130 RepID=A0A8H3R9J2_9GLOM|nr:kinase-like domain-containing protein [Rhizophagus clarus]